MRIGRVVKNASLAILAFCTNSVNSSAMDRHSDPPLRYHAEPLEKPSSRTADINDNPRCTSDSDGFFGDMSRNGVSLKYYYQVEYDSHVIPKVSTNILKKIQIQISDYLLPVLFQRACVDTRRRLAETPLRRQLEAVGISAKPDDVIVKGASCDEYEPTGDNSRCALAFGQASIFAQEGSSAEHQGDRAIESIEIIMEDGGLDGIVPGILKVSYLNGTHIKGIDPSVEAPGAVQNTSTEENTDESGGLPGYGIALIIVAVVGVLAVVMFLVVRKRQMRARQRRANANPGALAFEELSLDGRSTAI